MPPDRLRAHNPWNLPMTGAWRFQLAYGQIKAGEFQPSASVSTYLKASSSQEQNPEENAFDGSDDTRWCATGGDFPAWLQADLGKTRHVSGVTLTWEKPEDTYGCRIEGRIKDGKWITLANASVAPGIGSGSVKLIPADVRYIRVMVLDNSAGHWASLKEFQIRTTENGQEILWKPPVSKPANEKMTPMERDAFASPGFNDSAWHDMTVPSNWEMAGYSLPTYNSVDKSVGLYRRYVTVPASWAGKRIYWHFDGALDGAEVFINGKKAGYHESGYTAWDIDLTGLVNPGQRNLFAVRVSKRSSRRERIGTERDTHLPNLEEPADFTERVAAADQDVQIAPLFHPQVDPDFAVSERHRAGRIATRRLPHDIALRRPMSLLTCIWRTAPRAGANLLHQQRRRHHPSQAHLQHLPSIHACSSHSSPQNALPKLTDLLLHQHPIVASNVSQF